MRTLVLALLLSSTGCARLTAPRLEHVGNIGVYRWHGEFDEWGPVGEKLPYNDWVYVTTVHRQRDIPMGCRGFTVPCVEPPGGMPGPDAQGRIEPTAARPVPGLTDEGPRPSLAPLPGRAAAPMDPR